MLRLYQGSGSGEIQIVGKQFSDEDWARLRRNAIRILRGRDLNQAAELLEAMPFGFYKGTNGFGDEFCLLYLTVPVKQYEGWISFDDNGNILCVDAKVLEIMKAWGLKIDINVGPFSGAQRHYLKFHREVVYKKRNNL